MFQFQIGAIKSEHYEAMYGFVSFNSKLVRLKEIKDVYNRSQRIPFQFQIGAIKRFADDVSTCKYCLTFQFQIGAIKSVWFMLSLLYIVGFQFQIGAIKREKANAIRQLKYVSIPNWCD